MSMHSDHHHHHWYDFDAVTWQTAAVAIGLLALAAFVTWFNMSSQSLQVMSQSLPIP